MPCSGTPLVSARVILVLIPRNTMSPHDLPLRQQAGSSPSFFGNDLAPIVPDLCISPARVSGRLDTREGPRRSWLIGRLSQRQWRDAGIRQDVRPCGVLVEIPVLRARKGGCHRTRRQPKRCETSTGRRDSERDEAQFVSAMLQGRPGRGTAFRLQRGRPARLDFSKC
jgi:hypothetical protein